MRLILYVNAYRNTLYQVDRYTARKLGSFLVGQAGMHRLRDALLRQQQQPLSILVDLIEEEFRHDSVPHALGSDRRRMLERHAGKMFRGTPFRYSRVIGRSRGGRRDDKVLFSALTNPENLSPLLSLLEETAIPLAGILSLPVISAQLLKPLRARSENILLITEQPDGGLRETFLRKGQVQFSRLAPIQASSPEEYCRLLDAEVHKTQRYLNTLRLLAPGESVDVYPIADAPRCEAVIKRCLESEQLKFYPVDIHDLAVAAGSRDFPKTGHSDALFAFLLGNSHGKNHYAQPSHLKRMRSWQAALGLRAASWLLAVIGLSWSGMNAIDGWMADRERDQLSTTRERVSERYTRLTRELPVEPAQARAMREATALADSLERRRLHADDIFRVLGAAFNSHPALEMRELNWFTSDRPDARDPVSLTSTDLSNGLALPRFAVTLVSGALRHFDGSYQRAHRQVDELAGWLRQQPGVISVDIEHTPLDTRPESQIQGELDHRQQEDRATFELRVVMELRDESV